MYVEMLLSAGHSCVSFSDLKEFMLLTYLLLLCCSMNFVIRLWAAMKTMVLLY